MTTTTSTLFNINSKYTPNYVHPLTPTIYIQIERLNLVISLLYFTDENNKKIDVPDEILVNSYDFNYLNDKVSRRNCLSNKDRDYVLCCTDNYEVYYKKEQVLSLEAQRCWNIVSKAK